MFPIGHADPIGMGTRGEALELARFLAFDRQDAGAIARALQIEHGLSERAAMGMALNALAPEPELAPDPSLADTGLLYPY